MEDGQESGRRSPAAAMLPVVYDELRRLARVRMSREQPGQTLQATALVHEAYLRLTRTGQDPRWENRRHFFGAAAEAMRRILIERARARGRLKRGGELERVELNESLIAAMDGVKDDELVEVSELLERFEAVDPGATEVVKLRYFVGFSVEEVAELTGVSARTVKRQWAYARAWIRAELERE